MYFYFFYFFFVQIYIRGGHIIPMQGPGLTTTESRRNPYSLLVALDVAGGSQAFGDIYLDDGESENPTKYKAAFIISSIAPIGIV